MAFTKLFTPTFVSDIFSTESAGDPINEANNAIAAADAKGDGKAKVAGLLRLADGYLKKKDAAKAEDYLDEAAKLARKQKFQEGKAYMLIMQAKLELWYGKPEEAVSWAKDALKIFQKLDKPKATALASNMYAFVLNAAGKSAEGMKAVQGALRIYKSLDEKVNEVGVMRLMMDMYLGAGDTLRAGLVGWEIVKTIKAVGQNKFKVKLADVVKQIADIEAQGGDMTKTLNACEEAKELYEQAGDIEGMASTLGTMKNAYLQQGKYYEAVEAAKAIVELYKDYLSMVSPKLLGDAFMDLAKVYKDGDCFDEQVDAASQALAVYSTEKITDGAKAATDMLTELSLEQKRMNIKLTIELARDKLGHVPANLIIEPNGLDVNKWNAK
mmetsp:Transcript_48971/g.89771  ORF Transcript_48971/g.89771 Transcript_48971/m.89771 type:complete len:383 (+) Transcript_48971:61-1209(+)